MIVKKNTKYMRIKMSIKNIVMKMRKRVSDVDLLAIQKLISEEIERRAINDKNNSVKQ